MFTVTPENRLLVFPSERAQAVTTVGLQRGAARYLGVPLEPCPCTARHVQERVAALARRARFAGNLEAPDGKLSVFVSGAPGASYRLLARRTGDRVYDVLCVDRARAPSRAPSYLGELEVAELETPPVNAQIVTACQQIRGLLGMSLRRAANRIKQNPSERARAYEAAAREALQALPGFAQPFVGRLSSFTRRDVDTLMGCLQALESMIARSPRARASMPRVLATLRAEAAPILAIPATEMEAGAPRGEPVASPL